MIINQYATFCALFFLLTAFGVLATPRFEPGITAYQIGSFFLGFFALLAGLDKGYGHLYIVAFLTIAFKGLGIPWIMLRVVRRLPSRAEKRLGVGIPTSLICGVLLTIIAYATSVYFAPHLDTFYRTGLASGLSVTLLGMALITLRREALFHLIGLLVCENGVLMMGIAMAPNLPVVVEVAVLLDVIVAVIIFGILVLYIHETHETTDTAYLRRLRG
jgi:hydrogenase-4 component E